MIFTWLVLATRLYILRGLSGFYVPILNVTGHYTRNVDIVAVKVPNIKSRLGRHRISYRGPRFWNRIPSEIRMIHNCIEFKRII